MIGHRRTADVDEALVEAIAQRTAELVAPPPARLVDAAAIAEQLSVPASWVHAEARTGRIPHTRLGRYVRFLPDGDRHVVAPAVHNQGGHPMNRSTLRAWEMPLGDSEGAASEPAPRTGGLAA
jgi:hypothetical protein